jgi:hypothetical protein
MVSSSELRSIPPKHVRMFVNREVEYQNFERLIKTPAQERDEFILAFYGPKGIGKSGLLQKLEYECIRHNIAAASLILDREGSNINEPIDMMRILANKLGSEEFVDWFVVERIWFAPTNIASQPQSGGVNLQATEIKARDVIGGSVYHNSQVNNYYGATNQALMNPKGAESALTETFLKCLKEIVKKTGVVLLFDGFDSVTPSVRIWMSDYLLSLSNNFGGYGVLAIISLLHSPDFSYDPALQEKTVDLPLEPLTREHIIEYFQRREIPYQEILENIEACWEKTEGIPEKVSNYYRQQFNKRPKK